MLGRKDERIAACISFVTAADLFALPLQAWSHHIAKAKAKAKAVS